MSSLMESEMDPVMSMMSMMTDVVPVMVRVDGVGRVGGQLVRVFMRVDVDGLVMMVPQSDGREFGFADAGRGVEGAVHDGRGDQLGQQSDGDVGGDAGRDHQQEDARD